MNESIIRFHGGEKFVIFFVVVGLIIITSLVAVIFVPRAVVKIKTASEPATMDISVTLDQKIDKIPPTINAIPAKVVNSKNDLPDKSENEWSVDNKLTLKSDFGTSYLAYRSKDLYALANRELAKVVKNNWTVLDQNTSITVKEIKVHEASGRGELLIRAEGVSVPVYPYEKWRRMPQMSSKRILSVIKGTDGVRNAILSIFPPFWPFLPLLPRHIDFSLDI